MPDNFQGTFQQIWHDRQSNNSGSSTSTSDSHKKKLSYRFFLHLHPYVPQLVTKLVSGTVATLQGSDTEYQDPTKPPIGKPQPPDYKFYQDFFETDYHPNHDLVDEPYPVKDLDFTPSGAYSVYNWELFFHAPLAVAIHLSHNQQFEAALTWFHYIFDPTDNSTGPTPERFWKVKPFQTTDVRFIEEILINLATGADSELKQETIKSIAAWKNSPLRPHVVARYRQSAYMVKILMAYLDNLIAWGDALFRQDSNESINEATQIYILAANLLGPRPQVVPSQRTIRPRTYANLKQDLREFSDPLVEVETDITYGTAPYPAGAAAHADQHASISSLGNALYFCVPPNDKLLGYWTTVADRLFKIHNSLNAQGIFRQLPLFAPPIDPGMLAKAAAAGLDVEAILTGANQPLPLVRFQVLVQKATEICQEVKSLGNNLLAAMEKEDNEALSILRAQHERVILELAEKVKYAQLQEAIKSEEGLTLSVANAFQRYRYYERLLGKLDSDISLPGLDALDTSALQNMRFEAREPDMRLREINLGKAILIGQVPGLPLNMWEVAEIILLDIAMELQTGASILDLAAGVVSLIPQVHPRATPQGVGVGTEIGGVQAAKFLEIEASALKTVANVVNYGASSSAKVSSYVRRAQEWEFQSNAAAGEITQLFKQWRAAQIRRAAAEWEWQNHQQQIKNAQEIEHFLTMEQDGKQTNQAFYTWMKREVKGLYSQCFQFAFDVARKAERALQHELGDSNVSFIKYGYLAGKEGLLAGEKLFLDIKQMEMAYHDLNQREYEMTKHISLSQVNPLALFQLRATGACNLHLSEDLFDMDAPGQYFRRIKSVALSIPCVAGPYTSVNCKLTLLNNSIRKDPQVDKYRRSDGDDGRFDDCAGKVQTIVTSTAQNDSGLFETNLRDERYLPFEGSGVISDWRLELPNEIRQIDYDTISDVILHVRYTAREGGQALQTSAVTNLKEQINKAQTIGSVRLFSVRHEFPNAWAKFKAIQTVDATHPAALTLTLQEEHYPFWSQYDHQAPSVKWIKLFAKTSVQTVNVDNIHSDLSTKVSLLDDPSVGPGSKIKSGILGDPPPAAIGDLTLYFDTNQLDDTWIALAWGK